MEIYQLRTFAIVARLGHITRAAEVLHVTQPAVTAHIKALEQELGIALFDRSHGRITLTKGGELLLPEVEKTLAVFNSVLSKAKEMKGEVSGKAVIGTLGDPDFLRLGSFLNGLHAALPLLEIKTRSSPSGLMLDEIVRGDLSAGFYLGRVNDRNLATLPLRGVLYRIVAPMSYNDRLPGYGWREIAALPWIGAPSLSHMHELLVTLFSGQGVTPNVIIETDELSSLDSLVRAGVGLSLMREDLALAAAERSELAIWSHGAVDSQLSFVYLAAAESEPILVGMLSVIREVWRIMA
ncbi:LysR family transcriptional regulator [Herbaspirillum hiltneri N3]|uniref:LysR family transcriptional regulator n=1 Tax=Herbaspirillum hiltneri N3 TaxID=1262470 RepID=A0ABN4HXH5_9BURK|nr:LysR family transcriptional regulator [Herbaspirillum hiltneri]AKZ63384.1 LysR family transcriptional regulator [Herbaspirillum hiltneri N3]